jgi:hypothetical protein
VARPKTLRPADFAVMTTTAVLLNVRHDLATPADQHPMMAPGPVRVVHRGDVLAQPEISADRWVAPRSAVPKTRRSVSPVMFDDERVEGPEFGWAVDAPVVVSPGLGGS